MGFDSTSVKLFYTLGDITKDKPIQVPMNRVGKSNEYTYVLPASATDRTISYYFSAVDSQKKLFLHLPKLQVHLKTLLTINLRLVLIQPNQS
jgi:hypothetical protein